MIKLIFKNISITVDLVDVKEKIDVDFCGHYMLQFEKIGDTLKPTGLGMDGYGRKLNFHEEDVLIEKEATDD